MLFDRTKFQDVDNVVERTLDQKKKPSVSDPAVTVTTCATFGKSNSPENSCPSLLRAGQNESFSKQNTL